MRLINRLKSKQEYPKEQFTELTDHRNIGKYENNLVLGSEFIQATFASVVELDNVEFAPNAKPYEDFEHAPGILYMYLAPPEVNEASEESDLIERHVDALCTEATDGLSLAFSTKRTIASPTVLGRFKAQSPDNDPHDRESFASVIKPDLGYREIGTWVNREEHMQEKKESFVLHAMMNHIIRITRNDVEKRLYEQNLANYV